LSCQPEPPAADRVAGGRSGRSLRPEQSPAKGGAIESTILLKGAREIVIRHSGEDYRLRVTNNGKLILTK